MGEEGTKVIKLGGSVIAPKQNPLSADTPTIVRLSEELSRYRKECRGIITLVHGGGSFGHPLVRECLKKYGAITRECYSRVAHYMLNLNNVVMEALLAAEVPAVSIPARAICLGNEGKGHECFLKTIKELAESGLVPVTFGDVILSGGDTYEVISGDVLAWIIALETKADMLIFVTDVDGIFSKDPRKHPDAELIREAKARDIIQRAEFGDSGVSVTGAMLEKILIGIQLGAKDVKVAVINGRKPGNLYNALHGNVRGTVIWF